MPNELTNMQASVLLHLSDDFQFELASGVFLCPQDGVYAAIFDTGREVIIRDAGELRKFFRCNELNSFIEIMSGF